MSSGQLKIMDCFAGMQNIGTMVGLMGVMRSDENTSCRIFGEKYQ